MIVECPSCLTKFSIDSRQLADIEDPRFNCCRCGSYFELQKADASAIEASQSKHEEQNAARSGSSKETETENDHTSDSDDADELEEYFSIEEPSERESSEDDFDGSDSGSWLIGEAESITESQSFKKALGSAFKKKDSSEYTIGNASHSQSVATPSRQDVSRHISQQGFTLSNTDNWTPDTEAELEDLFEPKNSGEQLSLLAESSPKTSQAQTTQTKASQAPETVEEHSKHTSSAWSRGELHSYESEDSSNLVTAEWPDASGRRPSKLRASLTARHTGSEIKPSVMNKSLEMKRKSKVAELLLQAKERCDQEIQEHLTRRTSSGEEAPSSDSRHDAVEEKEKRKARRRARKQQKLIRDITFRGKKQLGQIPFPTNIAQKAPVACIASVPILCLILVVAITSHIGAIPKSIQHALHIDTDSLPRLPPPGLGIVGLSSSIVTLDSGHRALEIRGELLNATVSKFQRIQLLASLFNSENEKTRSLVVTPDNNLKAAQVVALDAEAIVRLQEEASGSETILAPNERLPFRIVFPGFTGAEKWFSTSVYSVESELSNI